MSKTVNQKTKADLVVNEINSAFKNLKTTELLNFFKETKYVPNQLHTFALKHLASKYNCVNIFNVLKDNGFDFNLGNGILLLDATGSLQSKNVDFLLKNITENKSRVINLCLSIFVHYSENEIKKNYNKIKDIFLIYGKNINKEEMKSYFEHVNPKLEKIKNPYCVDFINNCHLILSNNYLNEKIDKNEKKALKIKPSVKI